MLNLERRTLRELSERAASAYGEKEFLSFTGEEAISFEGLYQQVKQINQLLYQQGIQKGDKVAILSMNMPNWAAAYMGITSYGAVAVPILPEFHLNEIKYILEHSESRMLFLSARQYARFTPETGSILEKLYLLDNFADISHYPEAREELLKLPSVLPEAREDELMPTLTEEDLAVILYTSGTTGSSKGVMLSHKNLVFDAMASFTVFRVLYEDVFLSILPLAHTYENTIGFLIPYLAGSRIHYLRKPPTANALLPALKQVRPTVMLSVPLVIEKIYRNKVLPGLQGKKITKALYGTTVGRKVLHKVAVKKLMKTFGGRIRFFGIGGAKLDPAVELFLREGGFPYAIGYGLTETAPMSAGATAKNMAYQSTGKAMQDVEIILDEEGYPEGQGEVLIKGENVMLGYYKNPELTKKVISPEGYFRSGDLGCFDADGNLHIKGRIKNMIVGANGKNVYPEEIESVINNFQYVVESIVVQKKGKLVAMVHFNKEEIEKQVRQFLSDARDLREDILSQVESKMEELRLELHEYVNKNVNSFSRLQLVVVQHDPFEKTATQKIKRYLYF